VNKIRQGARPQLRLQLGPLRNSEGYQEVFPFRRSWVAIAVILVFDAVFLIPAITTFREAVELWSRPDDLFNLVAALFITFWLIGWSTAPLLLTTLLAVLLFGREVVTARPGTLQVLMGLPFAGIAVQYDPAYMRNLRIEHPPVKSGKAWRGPHIAFDYGANSGEFGSGLSDLDLAPVRGQIERATGTAIRSGEALPGELRGAWGVADLVKQLGVAAKPDPKPVSRAPIAVEDPIFTGSPSTLVLIAANLLPVFGAIFWGWDLGKLMLLYWAESAIIGLFNLCKIVVIGRWSALLAGPFFLGHFGGFMAVHFLFLYEIFIQGSFNDSTGSHSPGDVARHFLVLWPALLALFVSHGYSFFRNFIGRREYLGRRVQDQMGEPYSRIVFMHMVIIFGGGLSLVLGDPAPVLIMVILLKIVVDVRAHLKERRPRGKGPAEDHRQSRGQ
jgi:uncharacterized protein DUF6498